MLPGLLKIIESMVIRMKVSEKAHRYIVGFFLVLVVSFPVWCSQTAYGNSFLTYLDAGSYSTIQGDGSQEQPDTVRLAESSESESNSNLTTLSIIALFLLIILTSVMYIISRAQFKKLEKDLTRIGTEKRLEKASFPGISPEINEEMAYSLSNTIQKNQMLEELIQKMELRKARVGAEGKAVIELLIADFLKYKEGVNLRDFEMKFHPEYKEFISRLEKINPDLTLNEKRICIFLKLNMNSREISGVTGQSVHSINVARTRLRKKLNLTNTDADLAEFLISI